MFKICNFTKKTLNLWRRIVFGCPEKCSIMIFEYEGSQILIEFALKGLPCEILPLFREKIYIHFYKRGRLII